MGEPSILVRLFGESNFDDQERYLKTEFDNYNIVEYIFEKVEELNKEEDEIEYKEQRIVRIKAYKILLFTLYDDSILIIFKINGWDIKNKDPKVLFNLVFFYIGRIINKARSEILVKYFALKRRIFDSIHFFFARYTLLRKRIITNTKFNIDNDLEITLLYNAVKTYYTVNTKFWAVSIKNKTIIIKNLITKFSDIGNTKKRTGTNLSI